MKKFLSLAVMIFFIAACNKTTDESFVGNKYVATSSNGTEITLAFDAEQPRAFGKVVNNYNMPYTLEGDSLKFGLSMSTMMMGPENAMKAETEYHRFMAMVTSFRLADNTLILISSDGREMVFEKTGKIE
ncbi:MAG: META domain-containing protein [Lactobacillus sp.]|jgi:heat shock protein HslJ|nr:META domain-containing protein [Lactobacillus sp.]